MQNCKACFLSIKKQVITRFIQGTSAEIKSQTKIKERATTKRKVYKQYTNNKKGEK